MKMLINGSVASKKGNFRDANVLYFELILSHYVLVMKIDWGLSDYEIYGECNSYHIYWKTF